MLEQKSPNRWSCLATAFAIGLNVPLNELIEMIGHDGSEIINDLEEPYNRRAFHPQEISLICLRHNIAVIPIEAKIQCMVPKDNSIFTLESVNPIPRLLKLHDGVIVGNWNGDRSHAAYVHNRIVYDPTGEKYPLDLSAIDIRLFLILKRIDK